MASTLRQGGGEWGLVCSQLNLCFNLSLCHNLLSVSTTNRSLQHLLSMQCELLQGSGVEERDRSPELPPRDSTEI